MAKQAIRNIDAETRKCIRRAVVEAMELWPNAHLGDYTRREDMQSAFRRMRQLHARGDHLHHCAAHIFYDAIRHADM